MSGDQNKTVFGFRIFFTKNMAGLKKQVIAQSALEYVLLVAVAIISLLAINYLAGLNSQTSAFGIHFDKAKQYIAP
ncbi:hypothetical protein D4R78_03005 [bacterium]|nr:MAG: hypothetical protein D4R78_03005 [bacterium]